MVYKGIVHKVPSEVSVPFLLGDTNYQRSPGELLCCSGAGAGGQEGDQGDVFHQL